MTGKVAVGFSCGKDSIVCLDLIRQNATEVFPFFMYLVSGLEFQERYLTYIERLFSVQIIRMPHWQLSEMLANGTYRPQNALTEKLPAITIKDVENQISATTGATWFAYGMKRFDSLERNAMLKHCAGIDLKSRRCYPVMNHTNRMIYAHCRQNKIKLPRDYELFGRSFGRLWPQELIAIKQHFPKDYAKILTQFPHVEASIKRTEFKQVPAI